MCLSVILLQDDVAFAGTELIVAWKKVVREEVAVCGSRAAADATKRPATFTVYPAPDVHCASTTLLPGRHVPWREPFAQSTAPVNGNITFAYHTEKKRPSHFGILNFEKPYTTESLEAIWCACACVYV